jgi:transposase
MSSSAPKTTPSAAEIERMSSGEVVALMQSKDARIDALLQQVEALTRRVDWFTRQHFGSRSERFIAQSNPAQMHLGEVFRPEPAAAEQRKKIPAHTRRAPRDPLNEAAEALPFFDESRVPVHTIHLANPDIEGLSADQYEVIAEKVSYRLAQRPGSYVVLKYVRQVTKRRDTQQLSCPPAPRGVLENSRADVSFAAGLLVDKFQFHLPLYRQHQRLDAAGIKVSRPWLTQVAQSVIGLLHPIYDAQFDSIRQSRVKAMDETPIKADRTDHGKMKVSYFWPVYGEKDEVCFPFHTSRRAEHVREILGLHHAPGSVLLTDGYAAYESYTKKADLTHAQCWAHARREIFEAQDADPEGAAEALTQIQQIYAIEEEIREKKLGGEAKRLHRLTHSKPRVELFFEWIERKFELHGLRPPTAFTRALEYARSRRMGLSVFLTDPDVAIDTNHLERALRAIPMGRKVWNFCWTELGAQHVGVIQSLIVTCRLHGIDPYTYLVDVLQRVGEHPASRVAELTPRLWKTLFADKPLRSDLHNFRD